MWKITLLLGILPCILCQVLNLRLEKHWATFKETYGKHFTPEEDGLRFGIFRDNLVKILNHNLEADMGLHSYRLGINKHTHLSSQEFSKQYQCLNGKRAPSKKVFQASSAELPDEVDWRTKGIVTPVKDQKDCGSCWAFSAVASLEGQHAKASKNLVSLSEQNLVDCSRPEGNEGCMGGMMDKAFQYIKKNGGIDTEDSYPYLAIDSPCHFNKSGIGATLRDIVDIEKGSEQALQEAVATIGPISVAIDANHNSFHSYKDGIYDEPDCSSEMLDHGVTAVGYGVDEKTGSKYWLVKNSWGEDWGEKGYIKMIRNANNRCGIATMSSYPVV